MKKKNIDKLYKIKSHLMKYYRVYKNNEKKERIEMPINVLLTSQYLMMNPKYSKKPLPTF